MATSPITQDFDNLKSAKNIRDRARAQGNIYKTLSEAIFANREISPITINNIGAGLKIDVVDPTGTDDQSKDFFEGALWINSVNQTIFISIDDTIGSAIWVELTAGGGGIPVVLASDTAVGITKLSTAPAVPGVPIALGPNDSILNPIIELQGTAFIGGDKTGAVRGAGSIDIQGRTDTRFIAQGPNSSTMGLNNWAKGVSNIAMGLSCSSIATLGTTSNNVSMGLLCSVGTETSPAWGGTGNNSNLSAGIGCSVFGTTNIGVGQNTDVGTVFVPVRNSSAFGLFNLNTADNQITVGNGITNSIPDSAIFGLQSGGFVGTTKHARIIIEQTGITSVIGGNVTAVTSRLFLTNTVTITVSATINSFQTVVLANHATIAITVSLPSGALKDQTHIVKRTGTAAVTVDTADASLIDGVASKVFPNPNDAFTFVFDGSNWFII